MRPNIIALALVASLGGASVALAQTPPSTPTQPTTTAPVAGSNSFTESQARSRIEAAGFTDVTDLQKDDQGVWRGRASRNGASVAVGLDFQGHVVEGSAPAASR